MSEEALIVPNSIEWLEYCYQQEAIDDWDVPFGGISDAISGSTSFGDDVFPDFDTLVTSSVIEDTNSSPDSRGNIATNGIPVFRPENSSAASYDLSPKATISKQVRRRSIASRRTPATVLNASIKNFRKVVQQYTGCHSSASALKSGKGPITLSFGSSNQENDFPATSFFTSYGSNYYDQEINQHYYQQHVDQIYRGKQSSLSFGGENSSEFSGVSHSGSSAMQTVDNLGWY